VRNLHQPFLNASVEVSVDEPDGDTEFRGQTTFGSGAVLLDRAGLACSLFERQGARSKLEHTRSNHEQQSFTISFRRPGGLLLSHEISDAKP
jgi:hypothetical protein